MRCLLVGEFTSWYLVSGTKSDLDRKVRRPYLPSILMFPDPIHDMTVSLPEVSPKVYSRCEVIAIKFCFNIMRVE
jgi:hypothetical protein